MPHTHDLDEVDVRDDEEIGLFGRGAAMILECKAVGPFSINSYLLGCAQSRQAALIDPGGEQAWFERALSTHKLELRYLLLTHTHLDHVAGLAQAAKRWPNARIVLHREELPVYASVSLQGAMFGLHIDTPPALDEHSNARFVSDLDTLELGEVTLEVMHVPGHTPGHVVYIERNKNLMFSGDLLFAGSVGRTDLPGGSSEQLRLSLARVATLPRSLRVLSGHGPETTIAAELAHNPYLRPRT